MDKSEASHLTPLPPDLTPLTSCLCGLPTSWLKPSSTPGQVIQLKENYVVAKAKFIQFRLQVLVCHCSDCRAQSGSLQVPFAALGRHQVVLARHRLATFQATPLASRCHLATPHLARLFCRTCGAFVGMDYREEGHTVWLALGSLDSIPAAWLQGSSAASSATNTTSPSSSWLVAGRDCKTFLEQSSGWSGGLEDLPHLEGYGTYRPDPCRLVWSGV